MKKNAKKEALKMLSGEMKELMGDSYGKGMKGMKEAVGVKVMADSPEAASEGLSKAKKILDAKSKHDGEEDSEEEIEEHNEEKNEDMDYEDLSKEELIKLLMDK